ncbi:hypothetical protein ACCC98_15115 [Rhizobium pisi]|uniref:hypothetical protein n=1 Tax=Rhizobium pisi TaxID=574561 RepID=UPI0039AEA996
MVAKEEKKLDLFDICKASFDRSISTVNRQHQLHFQAEVPCTPWSIKTLDHPARKRIAGTLKDMLHKLGHSSERAGLMGSTARLWWLGN